MAVQWLVFPKSKRPCPAMSKIPKKSGPRESGLAVVEVFGRHDKSIDSAAKSESSNAVLAVVALELPALH